MTVLAHGVGTRGDLPVPVQFAALAGALVLVATFGVLAVTWRSPRLRGADGGRALPPFLDSAALRGTLRAGVTVLALAVVVIGFSGPPETPDNLAPWVLYVTFWVGLVPASLLFGPAWRIVNPLRALHAILARILRLDPEHGLRVLPAAVGLWPAAVSLLAFGWLELVHPDPADPRVVAWFLTGYAVVQVGAALVFGARWFGHGDGFEVWSELLGSLAPFGRRSDGRLVLRNPLDGLEAVRPRPGLVSVVLVLIGITGFDGLSRSSVWSESVPRGPVWGTVGLVAVLAAVVALYLAGTWRGRSPLPVVFAHALVPIAAGYAIAHYFSLLVFDGQLPFVLASDPFGTGADLFGTAGRAVDYTVAGTGVIAAVQLGAIVLGHVVAAVATHERAVRRFPAGVALRVQYPMLASMVMLTFGAVALVLAP